MLASWNFRSFKAGPNFECFGRWNRKHGVAECGFELVKHGFTQARRNIADDTSYGSTNRILGVFGPDDSLCINGK